MLGKVTFKHLGIIRKRLICLFTLSSAAAMQHPVSRVEV